jgi:hypothetical protein
MNRGRRFPPRARQPTAGIGIWSGIPNEPQFDREPTIVLQPGSPRAVDMDTQLIDRIYESWFEPGIWPDVLDELGRIAGANLYLSSKCLWVVYRF